MTIRVYGLKDSFENICQQLFDEHKAAGDRDDAKFSYDFKFDQTEFRPPRSFSVTREQLESVKELKFEWHLRFNSYADMINCYRYLDDMIELH